MRRIALAKAVMMANVSFFFRFFFCLYLTSALEEFTYT